MSEWIKCREQFEAWWEENQHNGNPPRFGWGHYRDGETYSDDEFQTLWEVWQGSRSNREVAIPTREQGDGWIDCRLDMPPAGKMVICYSTRYRQVENMTMRFEPKNQKWWSDIDGDWQGCHRDCISHWMPLPKPPQD